MLRECPPLVIRYRPYSGADPRWHLTTWAGITGHEFLSTACSTFNAKGRKLQLTYAEPTCKWCKSQRLLGEPKPTGRFAGRVR